MAEIFTCTRILYAMAITGFMVNYMLRVNLSMAIVDMVGEGPNRFQWSVEEKNLLLGIFFWGYILTDVVGGRLSEILGPRLIFGGGMLLASLVTLGTPWAALVHYNLALVARFVLGLVLGVTYPSIIPLAVKWIPPGDRSKFMSSLLSQGLGVALCMPLSGYLMAHFDWRSVFYVTGLVGLVWSCSWFYLVYDSPGKHPRISTEERAKIEAQLQSNNKRKRGNKLPLGKILTSLPVWSIIVMHGSVGFCHFTVITQLPTYMKEILQVDVKRNGLLSSLPSFGHYLLAIAAAHLADKFRLAPAKTRKIFAGLSCFLPAFFTVFLIIFGEIPAVSLAMIISSYSFTGLMSAGHLPNAIDIAPNFSGTIMGLATTLASLAGALSTKIVAVLTKEDVGDFANWKSVFTVMICVYVVGGAFFICFAKADVQEWNHQREGDYKNVEGEGEKDTALKELIKK